MKIYYSIKAYSTWDNTKTETWLLTKKRIGMYSKIFIWRLASSNVDTSPPLFCLGGRAAGGWGDGYPEKDSQSYGHQVEAALL